ncbi:DUF6298 domain-containing protein [Botrimarina sp.]|uniref:DUF6298 domain-containing protein n=1 Tax=Botrimarina sp. TaxID=2795802 RepID=UPI0032EBCF4D
MLPKKILLALLLFATPSVAQPSVRLGADGRLEYSAGDRGDRVPDFSSSGYAGGDREPPIAPVRVVVSPADGDNTPPIQAALDRVAELPAAENGLRGAVLLAPGEHRVDGRLRIAAGGVVLRGAGADRTRLVATGPSRAPVVRIGAAADQPVTTDEAVEVTDDYTAVGARELTLPAGHGLAAGDWAVVTRPSTDEWIATLDARRDGVGWRAGRTDVRWVRRVEAVDGGAVTLDAPITSSLDKRLGGGTVARITTDKRIAEVGLEDLTLVSESTSDNPHDEDHAWHGLVADDARNLWVRRVRFKGFAGGAVLLREGVQHATVEDCLSIEPVSELGGYRRHTFFTQGQQTLFLRCWSEHGLHDFTVGHCAAGPNAFVHCYAHEALGDSGPLESWASGVLYDNVRIDGGDLFLGNRWINPPGAGWSAANCMAWQCQAAQLHCYSPPSAQNWAVGYWARPIGDGLMSGLSDFVRPTSLFQAQLSERLGDQAARRVEPLLLEPEASTSPTIDAAAGYVARSNEPPPTLRDVVEERLAAAAEPVARDAEEAEGLAAVSAAQAGEKTLRIENGWLTIDGRVVTGGLVSPTWWRGTIRPDDAQAFGPAITRYAPGRYGVGLTDELDQVAGWMLREGRVVYDHHYGLWYDRRRDDHLMVRRATGEVAPPFYEQPFARTGRGAAWDGLSRYDLSRPNPWYWNRLADFSDLCDRHGLVLMHQCYFQHNVLEAGAHWADSPWRPVNNVNGTPFTEPPPYIGDKRIFIAHQFYDLDKPRLRELHEGYLRQCVDAFAENSNVIQLTGDEYTGPYEFTRFWLETLARLRKQAGGGGLIGLSATKDVQDKLLEDPATSDAVDLIDIRYWCYTRDGGLYAPPGGANMAPRQFQRQSRAGAGDFASVARAVRDYRTAYPDKPVTFYADRFCRTPRDGWAVLMGGGSLAEVPPLPEGLAEALVAMRPIDDGADRLTLADDRGGRLVYAMESGGRLRLPAGAAQRYEVIWIDPETGKSAGRTRAAAGSETTMTARVAWVRPL